MRMRLLLVGSLVVPLGWSGCGDDDAGSVRDAAVVDANGSDVCPAVGRPPDGTPCSHARALCYYDGERDGRLVFTCSSGNCPDAPCNALFTECGGQTFQHWDSTNCEGGI